MNNLTSYKLKEICTLITDGSHYSPKGCSKGYPMFSVKDMQEFGFSYDSCKYISFEDFQNMKKMGCVPQKNDILVAKDGSYLKQIFRCKETKDEAVLSSIAIFRPNTKIVDPSFLCHLLKSPKMYNFIKENCVSGSALPRIILKSFKEVSIQVPDISTQRKIGYVLDKIDEKIELNSKIIKNLEEHAFLYWKKYCVINCKYERKTLGEVTKDLKEKAKDKNYKVLSAVNTGKLQFSEEYFNKQVFSKDLSKYIIVRENDFAYNPARINIGSIGINDLGCVGCVSPVYVAFSVEEGYHHFFKYYFKSQNFKEEAILRSSGSVRQTLNYCDFALIEINYPNKFAIVNFNNIYSQILKQQIFIQKENKKLTELRKCILPKIISGKINVVNIEVGK